MNPDNDWNGIWTILNCEKTGRGGSYLYVSLYRVRSNRDDLKLGYLRLGSEFDCPWEEEG